MSNGREALVRQLREAVESLEHRFGGGVSSDELVECELHRWLDGGDNPLEWHDPEHVTPDEWFFITTLYGTMTLARQRTHIRRFFRPLLVEAAGRDVRNFAPGIPAYVGLRAPWMRTRLCRMGEILRERGITMSEYVRRLQELERRATPDNPTPALDQLVRDHRAGGAKTISVFVRDCVGGNCFPIDSRVERELRRRGLPVDERQLVGLSLAIGCNPRQVARMFYGAGGD